MLARRRRRSHALGDHRIAGHRFSTNDLIVGYLIVGAVYAWKKSDDAKAGGGAGLTVADMTFIAATWPLQVTGILQE